LFGTLNPMKYRPLGRTGVQVSELCLGAMNFGDGCSEADSITLMHKAIADGLNFFDTADVYSRGISETIVGKALLGDKRDKVFLATKVYNKMGDGPNNWGSHRDHIIRGCEDSLRRLQTDHIDLYQIHRPKSDIPIDETLRALDDLVKSGKVRYLGTSTFAAWQVVESLWASKELHLNRFICEQPPYNLLDRRVERELLPMCRTYGIATIPWAPIAGGILSGKYKVGTDRPEDARYKNGAFANRDNDKALEKVAQYVSWCEERGIVPAEFALAWVLQKPGVTSPIIGPKNLSQYEAYLKALDITVTEEDNVAMDSLFPPGTHVSQYYQADFGPNARWS
jgi:aryl-alcohol dehydrogenase-like predicted oxidoreductase